ncbi:MAG: hypothetical protein IJ662_02690 [Clostridia bacterium]|nr:hypothetical protein [Clostridia bacterium]
MEAVVHGKMNEKILLDAHDLQAAGISRTLAYQLLNRADMPVVTFGRRKYLVKDKFLRWLDENSGIAAVQ